MHVTKSLKDEQAKLQRKADQYQEKYEQQLFREAVSRLSRKSALRTAINKETD